MNLETPRRPLGRTGEQVSSIGLGGFHLGLPASPTTALRIVREAIDRGITFLDNSWDYHDGESERRLGLALRGGFRERAFLMTKTDGRTKQAALQQLDESLQRLRADYLDLWQLHEVIRFDDVDRIFARGGAIEALEEARRVGKVRFVGFTGHKDPEVHLRMLAQDFAWDTVQMPLSLLDAHYRSFEESVLPVLVARGIGVIGMKPLAEGRLPKSRTVTATQALHYALNLPTSVVVTGMQSRADLAQALAAATSFRPLSTEEVTSLRARTATAARDGALERYKTTEDNDATAAHPEWLEAA